MHLQLSMDEFLLGCFFPGCCGVIVAPGTINGGRV